jgi:hypothetical protein
MGLCEVYAAGIGVCLLLVVISLAIRQAARLNRSAVTFRPVSRVSTLHSLFDHAKNDPYSSRPHGRLEW